jgi:pimeloyl-ACP methyl ester carboxylesterase
MSVPLVLLPGTLCNEAVFAHQVASLAGVADTRVLPLMDGRTIAACASAVLRQVPERFALAGFSQGGLVALEMMRQAPKRVLKLCLLATNPRGSTAQNLERWSRWQREAPAGAFTAIVRAHTDNVYSKTEGGMNARSVVEEMAEAVGVETFMLQLEMLMSRTDSRPSLSAIGCPTLLIVGRQDRVTPLELHEEMRALIPGAALVPVEDCGHYAPLEQPQAVSALMHYWLQN